MTKTDTHSFDTGNTGVGDAFCDPDGDGYSNYDDYKNGTDPHRWDAPPPAGNLEAVSSVSGAEVSWNALPGPVLHYVIERSDPLDDFFYSYGNYTQIAMVDSNTTSFEDATPLVRAPVGGPGIGSSPVFNNYNSKYRVTAVLTQGNSQAAAATLDGGEPSLTVDARLVRNAAGRWQVVCRSIPGSVSALRLNWMAWDYYSDQGTFIDFEDVSTNSIVAGVYEIPDTEIMSRLSVPDAAGNPLPSSLQMLWVQGVSATGNRGKAVQAGPLFQDAPCFVDGREHLRQNLIYQLRAASETQPYVLCDQAFWNPIDWAFYVPAFTDYVESSILHRAKQWKQYGDGLGMPFFSHATYIQVNNLWPFEANYRMHQSLYDTNSVPADFTWNRTCDTIPAPAVLGIPNPYWISRDLNNLSDVGAANSGTFVSMESNAHNLFGLPFATAMVFPGGWEWVGDFGMEMEYLPIRTLNPGSSINSDLVTTFYSQTVEPVLQPVGYYFASFLTPGSAGITYSPHADNGPYPLPVNPGFSTTNQTPAIAVPIGDTAFIGGWQKLQLVNGAANKYAYLGQYFANALKMDDNNNVTTTPTGILSPYGEFFPTEPGPVALITMPTDTNSTLCGTGIVHVISMNTDANHDGTMDFSYFGPDQTTTNHPFRFWVNDSVDSGDDKGDGIPGIKYPMPNAVPGVPSCPITGTRDMVNFFPVAINIQSLLQALPSVTDLTFHLKQADSALLYVQTSLGTNNFRDYLTSTNLMTTTNILNAGPHLNYCQSTWQITAKGIQLKTDFLTQIRDQGNAIILVQASKATIAPLVLEVRQGTKVLASTSLYLSINGVEKMFRHKNLTAAVAGVQDGPNDRLADADVPNEPETNGKSFVFVHGYNVLPREAIGTFADMFKRMYWAGSHAKFYGVTWRGASTKGTYPFYNKLTPNYHTNVVNAFLTAPHLANFVATLTNSGPVTLNAHSLGNMVTFSAISDWDAPVSQYFAMDAAVAIEAIDSSSHDNVMIPSAWAGYTNRLYASKWHQLFPANDARSTLTWNNRLANLRNVDVYNFYSSGEEVLRMDDEDPPTDFQTVLEQQLLNQAGAGVPFGGYTWCWQEKGKGSSSQDWLIGSSHGGWSFTSNTNLMIQTNFVSFTDGQYVTNVIYRRMTPSEAANIPVETLRANTFFRFASVFSPNFTADVALLGPGGSAYAQANRNRILADAIPAMSLVIGANDVPKLRPQNGDDKNFDMMTFENGWPQSRLLSEEKNNWHHSDYHEVAYTFTYKLFDRFVTLGNLR